MLRVCSKCNLIHDHKQRCDKRVATRNITQDQHKLNSFYRSYKWQKLKNLKRKEELYQCEICRLKGRVSFGSDVHHIKKVATNWEYRLSWDNLLVVCSTCHKEIEKLNLNSKEEILNYYLEKEN